MENKELLMGRCKAEFERWYYKQDMLLSLPCDRCQTVNAEQYFDVTDFYELPETMQQGVLREFFESKGIIMCSYKPRNESEYAFTLYDINSDWSAFVKAPDYSTAFTHAIDKACEIINGKGE